MHHSIPSESCDFATAGGRVGRNSIVGPERRHIVAAVVDDEREFESLRDRLNEELRRRRACGEAVDPREHISGVVMEPGYLARSANGHLVRRALARGVFSAGLRPLELPGDMGMTEAHRQQ